MKKVLFLLSFSISTISLAETGNKMSQEDYVSIWSNSAVEQMQLYRIPASITIAQGILESGNGNSPLATEANNHFGIKCHDWTGDKYFMNDDAPNECFRKYETAEQSYMDHSKFLKGKTRYAKLFTLKIDDYKGWAYGLKEAGYATSPTYASRLIELIERLKLYQYDEKSGDQLGQELLAQDLEKNKAETTQASNTFKTTSTASAKGATQQSKNQAKSNTVVSTPTKATKTVDLDEALVKNNQHTVQTNKNEVKFIVAKKGDTFRKIAEEFEIGMWQLYSYNSYGPKKDVLVPGDIVYLSPKKMKAKEKNAVYVCEKSTTIREISQLEGIKIESLLRLNNMVNEEELIAKGQRILLR